MKISKKKSGAIAAAILLAAGGAVVLSNSNTQTTEEDAWGGGGSSGFGADYGEISDGVSGAGNYQSFAEQLANALNGAGNTMQPNAQADPWGDGGNSLLDSPSIARTSADMATAPLQTLTSGTQGTSLYDQALLYLAGWKTPATTKDLLNGFTGKEVNYAAKYPSAWAAAEARGLDPKFKDGSKPATATNSGGSGTGKATIKETNAVKTENMKQQAAKEGIKLIGSVDATSKWSSFYGA